MQSWHIPVLLAVVFGYIVSPALIKRVAQLPGRARNLVWQYFFAAVAIFFVAVVVNGGVANIGWNGSTTMIVMGIGMINAFACYCHWRAAAINLAITSVSTWADDVIAMALGYVFLREMDYLNVQLAAGVFLALLATIIFSFAGTTADVDRSLIRKIFFWIALYSVVWGGAGFSMRYFALQNISLWSYVTAWYAGSFLGAIAVFVFSGTEERGGALVNWDAMTHVLPLSLCIVTSLSLHYWAKMLAPITVITPIFQVSEMVFPTLAGLIFFKEHKSLNWLGWVAMALGSVGGLVIARSF